jgi:uncharacterized membrane protein (DUF106 family)
MADEDIRNTVIDYQNCTNMQTKFDELNSEILEAEVRKAIQQLKNGKSA